MGMERDKNTAIEIGCTEKERGRGVGDKSGGRECVVRGRGEGSG